MAGKNKVEQRRKELLNVLTDSTDGMTYVELEEVLGVKKRTLENDVKELRETGSEITIKNDRVKLKVRGDVVAHSNRQIIRQLRILTIFEIDEQLTEIQIENRLKRLYSEIDADDDSIEKENNYKKDTRNKTLRADLEYLSQSGFLMNELGSYKLGWKAPVLCSMSEYEPSEIYQLINEHAKGLSYQNILLDIAEEMKFVMQYKLFYDSPSGETASVLLGGRKNLILVTEELLNILNAVDFRKYLISVEYAISEEERINFRFAVGMMVFSMEHGKVYLMGKDIGEKEQKKIILDIQKIKKITKIDEPNDEYLSEEFKQIYDEMFGISVEEPYEVEVVFTDVFQIGQKLKRLQKNRKNATLTLEERGWVYRDKVRGLNDFAKYLRSFGMACIVMQPDILVEKMYNSAKKIYQLY